MRDTNPFVLIVGFAFLIFLTTALIVLGQNLPYPSGPVSSAGAAVDVARAQEGLPTSFWTEISAVKSSGYTPPPRYVHFQGCTPANPPAQPGIADVWLVVFNAVKSTPSSPISVEIAVEAATGQTWVESSTPSC